MFPTFTVQVLLPLRFREFDRLLVPEPLLETAPMLEKEEPVTVHPAVSKMTPFTLREPDRDTVTGEAPDPNTA